MTRTLALLMAVALTAGCGGGADQDQAVADSLGRDLELAPMPDDAPLDDRAAEPEPAPRPASSTSRPAPARPAPKPAPKPAQPPAAPKLAAGTSFGVTTTAEIASNTHKDGQTVQARVASAVKDSRGRVVIPAGSLVDITIVRIKESENKSDQTGVLELEPASVEVDGRTYALVASLGDVPRTLRDRATNAGDVAKVGAGAAAGAVVGRVIGGSTKGAVIGGIIGGAVGTQRAVETQDRDVVVAEGTEITVTLREALEIDG